MNQLNKIGFFVLCFFCIGFVNLNAQIIINEIDCDTADETGEFVELSGPANTPLDGHVLALFNGNGEGVYECHDLDGYSLDANGFFVIGNIASADLGPAQDATINASSWLQNGPDAVALYMVADCASVPACPTATAGLVDAVVYDTNDADDPELLPCLGETIQYNEAAGGNPAGESLQWDGTTFITNIPSPGAANNLTLITSVELTSSFYTVNEADGTVNAVVCVEIINPDALTATTVDITAADGDAISPDDYTFATQTLTFPAADGANQCATFDIVDDALDETGGETFDVFISNPTGGSSAVLGVTTMATVQIEDNDFVGGNPANDCDLIITGAYDGPLTGATPKGVELYVVNDIDDLSEFGLGSANNGLGSDGEEFTFPQGAVTAGTYIYVASEAVQFANFFGFAPDYTTSAMGINGDDAIELFHNGLVTDVFGTIDCDPNVTGTTCPEWEHTDGWAYRNSNIGPNGGVFTSTNWTYGLNVYDGVTTNATAVPPMPLGTYVTTPANAGCITTGCMPTEMISGTSPTAVEASATITVNPAGETTTLSGATIYDAPCVEINGDFDTGANELDVLQTGCTPPAAAPSENKDDK